MKQNALMTAASLLTILLMSFHLAGDILFGMAPVWYQRLTATAQ